MAISWVVTSGLGIGMLAAVCKVTSVSGFRVGWQGVPVYLALAGIIGRVANCKVILSGNVLTVVNPLRSHILPKEVISGASVGDDGTLEVQLHGGGTVSVFAYGGSLIDHYRGSSGQAERKISAWLSSAGTVAASKAVTPQARWTRCIGADASLALCVALAVAGAIWMAFTGD